LIADLAGHGVTVPIMLVSDYEEAQDAAVASGALRGFGKSQLYEPQTIELIRRTARGK